MTKSLTFYPPHCNFDVAGQLLGDLQRPRDDKQELWDCLGDAPGSFFVFFLFNCESLALFFFRIVLAMLQFFLDSRLICSHLVRISGLRVDWQYFCILHVQWTGEDDSIYRNLS